jgi:O-antigen ligase
MFKKSQDFLICCYFFSINFQEYKLFNLGFLSIPKIIAILYILFLLPNINYFLKTQKINFILFPLFSYFLFLFCINILNINTKSFAIFDFTLFINIILFCLCTIHFSRDFKIANRAILSLALGSVFLALFYFLGIGVDPDENGRISIFGDNPNFVGIKMAISIILILFIVIQNSLHFNWLRYMLFFPIPIMLKLLIETGSRISLISFILMMFVGFYFVKKNGFLIKVLLFIIFSGLVFYIYNFILENQFLLLRLSSSIEDKDLAGREVIYIEIWEVIKNNFLIGIGQTGYFAKFGVGSPHNVLLEILCYSGILGLTMYLLFLFNILRTAFKAKVIEKNILPLILLIPLFGLIFTGQILTLKLGWVIFSYIASRIYFLNTSLKVDSLQIGTKYD